MGDDRNADSKTSSEDHERKKSSSSKSTKEEDSKTTNNESVKSFDPQRDTDWFSLTSFNTELSTRFEPYPFGSDGAMMYEDLRAKLREIPRSIIDYMGMLDSKIYTLLIEIEWRTHFCISVGYVPNSVIRLIIGKWVQEYREVRHFV